jgi:hypothetical protein
MFTKIAPQFRKVLYKWTPQEAKLLHGLKNLFQALYEGNKSVPSRKPNKGLLYSLFVDFKTFSTLQKISGEALRGPLTPDMLPRT